MRANRRTLIFNQEIPLVAVKEKMNFKEIEPWLQKYRFSPFEILQLKKQ